MNNRLLEGCVGWSCSVLLGVTGGWVKGTVRAVEGNWLELENKKGVQLIHTRFVAGIEKETQ